MKVSLNWIKEYFDEGAVAGDNFSIEKVSELLTAHSFEDESTEEEKAKGILNLDVLPNRAHDCLCHWGIAKEVSAVTGVPFKPERIKPISYSDSDNAGDSNFFLRVESDICRRYIGVQVNSIKVGPSPEELKQKLEAIGERSINNIVDITNIVMFELGQPMHAFDADKIDGGEIIVRAANNGEKITTLDNKNVELDESMAVIADASGALAIAGVKGGKKAEVNEETKNIVLEAANFQPTKVRLASRKLGIQTESSKRFENEISPYLAEIAMQMAVTLIKKYASTDNTVVCKKIEQYPLPVKRFISGVSLKEVQNLIGQINDGGTVRDITVDDIKKSFDKLGFEYEILDVADNLLKPVESLVGKKYKYGASIIYEAPETFDCSALTSYLFYKVGISLIPTSVDQMVSGIEIDRADLRPGDLVFSNVGFIKRMPHHESIAFLPKTQVPSGVDHVGIYLGNGKILHATELNDMGVVIEDLDKAERFTNIVGYRRYFEEGEKRFVVQIPHERMDLIGDVEKFEMKNIDLIEEVGRILGYTAVAPADIEMSNFKPNLDKEYFYKNKISDLLVSQGFSEIMTYTFSDHGFIQPEKPLSSDKNYLRANLKDGMQKSLELNARNADLLELDTIKTFEIGKVFNEDSSETLILCLGVMNKSGIKKPKTNEVLKETIGKLSEDLGANIGDAILSEGEVENGHNLKDGQNTIEIDLSKFIETAPEISGDYVRMPELKHTEFKKISSYPFIVRDIAVWIPNADRAQELLFIINDNAGDLLVGVPKLFDKFEKEDKTSYAYRMVYQSEARTLTDEEVNKIMDKIYTEVKKRNWEIR